MVKFFSFKKKHLITFHPFSMVSKKWKLSRYEWPTATWWKRNKRTGQNENAEEACINIFGSYANGRALVKFHNLWYSKSECMNNGNHNNVPIIRYQMNSSQAILNREENNKKNQIGEILKIFEPNTLHNCGTSIMQANEWKANKHEDFQ